MVPHALLDQLAARLGPKGFTRDPELIAPWLTDWRGRFTGQAPALLSPGSTDEVRAVVAACAAARVPLVTQGGNTGMVGGATPPPDGRALLLTTRRLRAIRAFDADAGRIVAEAGVTLAEVHERAASEGLRFPLSLGARGSATVGGLLSTNAGGVAVLRWGTMRALTAGLEAVLPDGALLSTLRGLPKDNRGPDVAGLLIGAEGTLGVITAASLKLVPEPDARAVAWVGLADAEAALPLLRALERHLPGAVESFELVPARALDLVLRHLPGARPPLARAHDWNVLIESVGDAGVADRLADALGAEGDLVADATIAASARDAAALWALREGIAEAERREGRAAKHDISVPVSAMPGFIVKVGAEVERRFPGTAVIAFGHLGDGNVHFNVLEPAGAGSGWLDGESAAVTRLVHDRVIESGGSISAEHGIGQMKRAEYLRTADGARLAAQAAIKAALDPHGIMNPGKLVGPADVAIGNGSP